MNTRIFGIGILAGALAAAALALPWYFILPARYVASWPVIPQWLGYVGYSLAGATVFAAGYAGSRWSWASTPLGKCFRGGMTGIVAALVAWLLVGVGAAGVLGHHFVLQNSTQQITQEEVRYILGQSVLLTVWFVHISAWAMTTVGALLGIFGGLADLFHGQRAWGAPPRPTHPRVALLVALTTMLIATLLIIVAQGTFAPLEDRIRDLEKSQPFEPAFPPEGVTALPVFTLIAVLCWALWPIWNGFAHRYRYNTSIDDDSIRRITLYVGIGLSIGVILILSVIDPQFFVRTYFAPATALLIVNLSGLIYSWSTGALRRKPLAKTVKEEVLPVTSRDWSNQLLTFWWVIMVLSAISTMGVGAALFAISVPFAAANGEQQAAPIGTIFLVEAIRGAFLVPIAISFVVALFVLICMPLYIVTQAISNRVLQQVARADEISATYAVLRRVGTVHEVAELHKNIQDQFGQSQTSVILRLFLNISQDVEAALNQQSIYNQRVALRAVEDRLNKLSFDLSRSGETYSSSFNPIAQSWRAIVAEANNALVAELELRQEIDSPYIIGVPLTAQQELFVGRNDISTRIEQLLLDRRRPPLLLYGQRRMGKTSLLNNLGRLLPSTIVPLFVDLQGPVSRSNDHSGMLFFMARSMLESASQHRQINLPSMTREQLERDPFGVFDEWLSDVEQHLSDATGLLMLDEFEALDQALARGRFDEERVLGMLRHIIQHRPRFKILLAGSHTLNEFRRWSSYLINAQVVQIGYLQEHETCQLVERPVKDFALRYEPEASSRITALTRGHPFLVQLLCAEIVALKNGQDPAQRRLARLEDIELAVPEALASGDMFFADIANNQVDEGGAAMLRWIAAHGEGAIVGEEQLVQQAAGQFEPTLRLLLQRDLIERVDGGYRFQVELIRCWFAQN